jgi:hypothetical protein
MPFHIQAKNTQTGEIYSKEPVHAHPEHAKDPSHPNYHNRAHIDNLSQARTLCKLLADSLNQQNNTNVWQPVNPPAYYPDPRYQPHAPGAVPYTPVTVYGNTGS